MNNKNFSTLKRNELSDWLYTPSWRREEVIKKTSQDVINKMKFLLFSDNYTFSDALIKHLKFNAVTFSTVTIGKEFKKISHNEYMVNPKNKNSFLELFSELSSKKKLPDKIIYSWPLIENCFEYEDYFNQLLYLIQASAEIFIKVNLSVLISNAYPILGTEEIKPEKSMIIGPCKVVNKEIDNFSCKIIDIGSENDYQNDRVFVQIIEDILSDKLSYVVAYRGKFRWVSHYQNVFLPKISIDDSLLKYQGTYLITGGTGGIGLKLATHLAKSWNANLILVSRTVLPPKSKWGQILKDSCDIRLKNILLSLNELNELGVNFLELNADVSNFEQMQMVFDSAYNNMGKIDGIIHAAGIAGAGLIQLKNPEKSKQVFAPKAEGLRIIEKLVSKKNLDFLFIFSSLSSILGEFGQADYCSANAFLDSFAYKFEDITNIRAISVNWGSWAEVGMVVNNLYDTAYKNKSGLIHEFRDLQGSILTSEGIKIFEMLLTTRNINQVIVSPFELNKIIENQQNFSIHNL